MGPRVLALVCSLATSCTFAVRGLPLTSTDGSTGSDASVSDGPGNDLGGSCDGCLLGCGGVPMHCLAFAPAGPVQPGDYGQAGLQPLVLSSDTTFNTDDGSITGGLTRAAGAGVQTGISFRQATQGNGATNVGVFGFAMLTIADGVTVSFTGDSAVAFASAGDVSVVGTINAVGLCIAGVGGPGGGRGGATGADGGGPGRGGRGGGTADKASGGGGGGTCRMRHQKRARSNTHSSRPNNACTLIQNDWVRFGQESCRRPRTPTPTTSKNITQCKAMAPVP